MADEPDSRDPLVANPFQAPVLDEVVSAPGLGVGYWVPIALVGVISVLLLFSGGWAAGWFGIATTVFAAYHGYVYQDRKIRRAIAGESVQPITNLALAAGSLFLGAAATTASGIAFVATCFPLGAFSMSLNRMNQQGVERMSGVLTVLVWGGCGLFAILLSGALLRLFVPRRPSR